MNINTIFNQSLNKYLECLKALLNNQEQLANLNTALESVSDIHAAHHSRILVSAQPCYEPKAQHLVEELVGKFKAVRPPVPAILVKDPAHFPAKANDTAINFGSALHHQPLSSKVRFAMNIDFAPNEDELKTAYANGRCLVSTPHFAMLSLLVHLICERFEPTAPPSLEATLETAYKTAHATSLDSDWQEQLRITEAQLVKRLSHDGLIFTAGNGGSACDTADLGNHARIFPLLESGYITCVANDFGFEKIFSRAVECLTPNQDTLIALSTSGQSPNIVAATKCAQERSVFCLFLGGPAGGPAADYADCKLLVHGDQTARIQEIHALTLHCLGIWIRGVHQNNATH